MKTARHTAALTAVLGLLLSGCVSMPDSGGVDHVESSRRAKPDSQVRVFGVSPQAGEEPQQIVRGFLEATTSDEANFSTAREYLTPEAAEGWDPFARTTVLSGGPSPGRPKTDADGHTVRVTGTRKAVVDRTHSYASDSGSYHEGFHLTEHHGQWRIDRLPDGLALGEADFQRIYRPVNTYFYALLGPDGETVAGGRDVLVADPVHLRRRIDPVTETVSALLAGPSSWLDPSVSSAFPHGAGLAGDQRLSLDESGSLTVRLNTQGARTEGRQCVRMAAQVLHTVQDQASTKVGKVTLQGPDRRRLCAQTREQAEVFAPGRLAGRSTYQYFIDGEKRVARVAGSSEQGNPVPGPLGTGHTGFSAVAVDRAEREGAAVTAGRRSLYVAPLDGQDDLGAPVLTSKADDEEDRLTTPTWDGLGDLWIADGDPDRPRLLRLRGGSEEPEEVDLPGLGAKERIESVHIASDGVRIALRIRADDGRRTLQLGRVDRSGTPERPVVAVSELKPVAPKLEDVAAASWAGGSRLVVVGREADGVQQLRYMETDGSAGNQPTLPGINDVTGVAASEDDTKPLLADSEDGIVRLPPDENWKRVTENGSAPVHPG